MIFREFEWALTNNLIGLLTTFNHLIVFHIKNISFNFFFENLSFSFNIYNIYIYILAVIISISWIEVFIRVKTSWSQNIASQPSIFNTLNYISKIIIYIYEQFTKTKQHPQFWRLWSIEQYQVRVRICCKAQLSSSKSLDH